MFSFVRRTQQAERERKNDERQARIDEIKNMPRELRLLQIRSQLSKQTKPIQ